MSRQVVHNTHVVRIFWQVIVYGCFYNMLPMIALSAGAAVTMNLGEMRKKPRSKLEVGAGLRASVFKDARVVLQVGPESVH